MTYPEQIVWIENALANRSACPEQIVWISNVAYSAVEWGLLILMNAKTLHRVRSIIDYQELTLTK